MSCAELALCAGEKGGGECVAAGPAGASFQQQEAVVLPTSTGSAFQQQQALPHPMFSGSAFQQQQVALAHPVSSGSAFQPQQQVALAPPVSFTGSAFQSQMVMPHPMSSGAAFQQQQVVAMASLPSMFLSPSPSPGVDSQPMQPVFAGGYPGTTAAAVDMGAFVQMSEEELKAGVLRDIEQRLQGRPELARVFLHILDNVHYNEKDITDPSKVREKAEAWYESCVVSYRIIF